MQKSELGALSDWPTIEGFCLFVSFAFNIAKQLVPLQQD